MKNFFNLYLPLADSWQILDNSKNSPMLIASKMNNVLSIDKKETWNNLEKLYGKNT